MRSFWPEGSTVYNVDPPETLKSSKATSRGSACGRHDHDDGPFHQADSIDFSDAYLFSTWALTETTFETWEYYIERAAALAGAYVVGWRGWKDIPDQVWPGTTARRLQDRAQRPDTLPRLRRRPNKFAGLAAVNR